MTTLNELTRATSVDSGDLFPIWKTSEGDSRAISLTTIQSSLSTDSGLTTQYAAPSATGFSVTVGQGNTWLILTPVAGYAAGTIVLPTPADKDEVLVNCTQSVTTLTVSSDKTVTGAPTILASNAFFRLRYDAGMSVWYRVG